MPKYNVKASTISLGGNVAQVRSSDIDLGEVSMVETTTISDGTKTMSAGLRDTMGGTVTVVWDPALHATAMSAYMNKTSVAIAVTYAGIPSSGGTTPTTLFSRSGQGFITNISAPIGGADAVMECTFSFKLRGDD